MASPISIRELAVNIGTTFNKTFGNAASADWNRANYTATKIRVTAHDDSGLVQEGIPDETLQTRMHAKPAHIEGQRLGTLKFSTYAGAAWTNISSHPEAQLLQAFMGGLQGPTNARTSTVGATGCTTTNINIVSVNTYVVAGQAVKIGTYGDGRGGAEVYPVNSVGDEYVELSRACVAAPSSGDAVVFSTTAYLDEDASQRYVDTLQVGHATEDQRQTIGGVGTFTLTGMGPGELPKLEIELQVADHQWVASGDRSSLTSALDPIDGGVPYERGIGLVHLGDHDDSTRTARKCGSLVFNPGVAYEMVPEPSGPNGVGGWQHMPGSPTVECTLLIDEDYGLVADWEAQTAKMAVLQMGHATAGTVAVELPKGFIDTLPVPDGVNNLTGLKIVMHGTEDYTASNDLVSSAVRIHWF